MKGHYDLDTAQVARFTKFYVGYFCKAGDITNANWEEAIDIVEKTLIIAHSPALNSQDVKGFLAKDTPNILIFNRGERGSDLPPKVIPEAKLAFMLYSINFPKTDTIAVLAANSFCCYAA